MKNIKKINEKDKELLFKKAKEGKWLGGCDQGSYYLYQNEYNVNEVVKIFDKENTKENVVFNPILDDEYNLDSFAFPKQIFSVEDKLVAYTTKYHVDFFRPNNIVEGPIIINTEMLKIAISKFIDDLKVISEDGVYLSCADFNLIFDNYNLVAIDLFNCFKRDQNTFDENIENLKSALKLQFEHQNECILDIPIDFDQEIDTILEVKNGTYMKKYFINHNR